MVKLKTENYKGFTIKFEGLKDTHRNLYDVVAEIETKNEQLRRDIGSKSWNSKKQALEEVKELIDYYTDGIIVDKGKSFIPYTKTFRNLKVGDKVYYVQNINDAIIPVKILSIPKTSFRQNPNWGEEIVKIENRYNVVGETLTKFIYFEVKNKNNNIPNKIWKDNNIWKDSKQIWKKN